MQEWKHSSLCRNNLLTGKEKTKLMATFEKTLNMEKQKIGCLSVYYDIGKTRFSLVHFSQRSGGLGLVMGPGQKFLTRVGSIFCGSGRVRKYPGWRRVGLLFSVGQK